jgi:hypothetical protein
MAYGVTHGGVAVFFTWTFFIDDDEEYAPIPLTV